MTFLDMYLQSENMSLLNNTTTGRPMSKLCRMDEPDNFKVLLSILSSFIFISGVCLNFYTLAMVAISLLELKDKLILCNSFTISPGGLVENEPSFVKTMSFLHTEDDDNDECFCTEDKLRFNWFFLHPADCILVALCIMFIYLSKTFRRSDEVVIHCLLPCKDATLLQNSLKIKKCHCVKMKTSLQMKLSYILNKRLRIFLIIFCAEYIWMVSWRFSLKCADTSKPVFKCAIYIWMISLLFALEYGGVAATRSSPKGFECYQRYLIFYKDVRKSKLLEMKIPELMQWTFSVCRHVKTYIFETIRKKIGLAKNISVSVNAVFQIYMNENCSISEKIPGRGIFVLLECMIWQCVYNKISLIGGINILSKGTYETGTSFSNGLKKDSRESRTKERLQKIKNRNKNFIKTQETIKHLDAIKQNYHEKPHFKKCHPSALPRLHIFLLRILTKMSFQSMNMMKTRAEMEQKYHYFSKHVEIKCQMCIDHNEALYWCNTCRRNICNFCKLYHEKVWIVKNHDVQALQLFS